MGLHTRPGPPRRRGTLLQATLRSTAVARVAAAAHGGRRSSAPRRPPTEPGSTKEPGAATNAAAAGSEKAENSAERKPRQQPTRRPPKTRDRERCWTVSTCSTSARTGCAASTTPSGSSRWSRPASTGTSPPAHPGRARRTTCPPPLTSLRRPPGRDRRAEDLLGRTGWSPSPGRVAPARPGSPSRSPRNCSRVPGRGLDGRSVARRPAWPRDGRRPGCAAEPGRPVLDTCSSCADGGGCCCPADLRGPAPGRAGLVRRLLAALPAAGRAGHRRASRSASTVSWSGGSRRWPPADAFALLSERAVAARGGERPGAAGRPVTWPGWRRAWRVRRWPSSWPRPVAAALRGAARGPARRSDRRARRRSQTSRAGTAA
jgi:hypothetical protein